MITINITLLLELNTDVQPKSARSKKKRKKGKEKLKKQKSRKGRKSGEKSISVKKEKPEIERPAYEYSLGGPVAFAHIEYQILPDKPTYLIDVNCWGPIAKVYHPYSALILNCNVYGMEKITTGDQIMISYAQKIATYCLTFPIIKYFTNK